MYLSSQSPSIHFLSVFFSGKMPVPVPSWMPVLLSVCAAFLGLLGLCHGLSWGGWSDPLGAPASSSLHVVQYPVLAASRVRLHTPRHGPIPNGGRTPWAGFDPSAARPLHHRRPAPATAAAADAVLPPASARITHWVALLWAAATGLGVAVMRLWISQTKDTLLEASPSQSVTLVRPKTIYLVRHGETEMNVWLREHKEARQTMSKQQKIAMDPGIYDSVLTSTGRQQARGLAAQAAQVLGKPPDVIISSPLSRALETAELGLRSVYPDVPAEVDARISERVRACSEYGSDPAVLATRFPGFSGFNELPQIWWWRGTDSPDPRARSLDYEPAGRFIARLESFLTDLAAREEETIAVVCHWGICISLTGRKFGNCELVELQLSDLCPSADTGLTARDS